LIAAIIIYACDKNDELLTYELEGNWKVVSYEENYGAVRITKTDANTWTEFNNGDVTVNFIHTDSIHGTITGRTVTNNFSGNFTIDRKGGIVFENVITTEINEPEWGDRFHAIGEVKTYEIRDGRLILYNSQRSNCIKLERK